VCDCPAEQGQRDAQYCIGCCLARGQGVAVDWPQAALWLSRAFDQVRASVGLVGCRALAVVRYAPPFHRPWSAAR
jgi:TPR repeat protein